MRAKSLMLGESSASAEVPMVTMVSRIETAWHILESLSRAKHAKCAEAVSRNERNDATFNILKLFLYCAKSLTVFRCVCCAFA
ncbi:MAG: hypothetical protein A2X58_14825 [Nitrospirae bacterium GWC2_56_14]|nr:MAG: hypothetical protein A2X58_14825 [Nitrospirae bacterium GWC2_56_14]